ncbi:MAG: hypothetical protein LWW79_14065 [Holophagaceae bacterium]|nr:hypothetical protein [Holophagaceae bacterium]
MAPNPTPVVHVKKPNATNPVRWRVVVESYTEYSTVVEASSKEEAAALAVDAFSKEDDYHGEAWNSLGTLYKVKALGRARNRSQEPPEAEFYGPDEEGWAVPAPPLAPAPAPPRRGRPRH